MSQEQQQFPVQFDAFFLNVVSSLLQSYNVDYINDMRMLFLSHEFPHGFSIIVCLHTFDDIVCSCTFFLPHEMSLNEREVHLNWQQFWSIAHKWMAFVCVFVCELRDLIYVQRFLCSFHNDMEMVVLLRKYKQKRKEREYLINMHSD